MSTVSAWSSQVDPSSTAEFYNFDLTGSTVGMTDATGQYVNRFQYLPFGESTVTAGAANLFMYLGALRGHPRSRRVGPHAGPRLRPGLGAVRLERSSRDRGRRP